MFRRSQALCFQFITPKSAVYQAICERLEAMDRITDATECFRQMVGRSTQGMTHREAGEWVYSEWAYGEWLRIL